MRLSSKIEYVYRKDGVNTPLCNFTGDNGSILPPIPQVGHKVQLLRLRTLRVVDVIHTIDSGMFLTTIVCMD